MEILWAPWRLKYVLGEKSKECVFCVDADAGPDELKERHILYRSPLTVVLLNRYPYNSGHLLVAPRQHKAGLEDLTLEEMTDLMRVLRESVLVLKKVLAPHGFNIGINLGAVAGAGIEPHLHIHVVPRWTGDSNFMSVVCETRVIPEELDSLFERLWPHFSMLAGEKEK